MAPQPNEKRQRARKDLQKSNRRRFVKLIGIYYSYEIHSTCQLFHLK